MRPALLLLVLVAGEAAANPRPLPMTYTSETMPAGGAELETFIDFTPLRALSSSQGAPTWYFASVFQIEFEYAFSDRIEFALYLTLAPDPGDAYTSSAILNEGNGAKQRVRWALAAPGEWPIDVDLYTELVENQRAFEVEAKIILQRRFGALRLVTNLSFEEEFYYTDARDHEIDISLGATYEVWPSLHVGLEGWSHTEFPDPAPAVRPYGIGPHVYLGPTVMFTFGRFWYSCGAYVRLTDFDHEMQPGEPYGAVWMRAVLGIDL